MRPECKLFCDIAIKLKYVDAASLRELATGIRASNAREALVSCGLLTVEQADQVEFHRQRLLDKRRARAGSPKQEDEHNNARQPESRASLAGHDERAGEPQATASRRYLDKVLEFATRKGASDVHIHSGSPILARIDGNLRPLKGALVIQKSDAERTIRQVLTEHQQTILASKSQVDFAYALPGIGRYRANVYRQHRGLDAVFRIIPEKPPTLEELCLPKNLSRLTDFRTGLVLCTGPSGCGKSTTLAAILDQLIQERKDHVITVENPIEFVFKSTTSWVNQRQLLDHTQSFDRALRAALRQDPDVIAITELRDRESIGLALSAAETGHLVLGSLHTGSAGQTIDRMVNAFPAEEQGHVRSMLSESLRAVVSQRLLPRKSGSGRVPAVEVLMCTTAVANMIRDNKTFQLPSIMQTGATLGMVTLDNSLSDLVAKDLITKDVARSAANDKERFE